MQNDAKPVEKWIVIIVKDLYLKTTLIKDIEFQKTRAQQDEEMKEEEKRIDDERPRKCPKCSKDYVPKDARFGECYYHDGFIIDLEKPEVSLTADKARAIMQRIELIREQEENKAEKTPLPRLLWVCCGHRYGESQMGCRTASCGLPEQLEGEISMQSDDYLTKVQEYFMQSPNAIEKRNQLLRDLNKPEIPSIGTKTSTAPAKSTKT